MNREGARVTKVENDAETWLANILLDSLQPNMNSSEFIKNLGLVIPRMQWADIMHMMKLYEMIVPVHGVFAEFGVLWGKNLSLAVAMRGILEPYNLSRKILGFDTFKGFADVSPEDGSDVGIKKGYFDTVDGYEEVLTDILTHHESQSPISHIKKFELIKGNIIETLPRYIKEHPETVFALVYIDVDLFKPTQAILHSVMDLIPKGGILAFDELGHNRFPGETLAVRDALKIRNLKIQRFPFSGWKSFVVME